MDPSPAVSEMPLKGLLCFADGIHPTDLQKNAWLPDVGKLFVHLDRPKPSAYAESVGRIVAYDHFQEVDINASSRDLR